MSEEAVPSPPPAVPEPAPTPRPPRSQAFRILGAIGVILLVTGAGIAFWYKVQRDREWQAVYEKKEKGLAPSGGRYFDDQVLLKVPRFLQNDPRWGNDLLGPSDSETLGSHGCAVSSSAMVMAFYGVDTDPQRLNDFLNGHNGFTPEAWIYWEIAALLNPDQVKFVYEDDPSYKLIDENLEKGNPVIVRLGYPPPRVTSHFVVICGKSGYDYLIMDPGAGEKPEAYPLKETGTKIDALRFYELVKK